MRGPDPIDVMHHNAAKRSARRLERRSRLDPRDPDALDEDEERALEQIHEELNQIP